MGHTARREWTKIHNRCVVILCEDRFSLFPIISIYSGRAMMKLLLSSWTIKSTTVERIGLSATVAGLANEPSSGVRQQKRATNPLSITKLQVNHFIHYANDVHLLKVTFALLRGGHCLRYLLSHQTRQKSRTP